MSSHEEQIAALEQRIQHLEQQLKQQNTAVPQTNVPPISPAPQRNQPTTTIPPTNTPPQTHQSTTATPPMKTPPPANRPFVNITPPAAPMYAPQNQTIPPLPNQRSIQPSQQADMEQTFGSTVMGILASVFIFASILVAYFFLPGIVKMVGLYVIGAGVTAAGLLGVRKKKYRTFFLSIAGCGAGILYLSIFLSYWYFSAIGRWGTYGMLLLWAVLVFFVSKRELPLFRIIGQCGILLSILFAFTEITIVQTMVALIFFAGVSTLYQFADRRTGILPNASTLICNGFAILMLTELLVLTERPLKASSELLWVELAGVVLLLFTILQGVWFWLRIHRPAPTEGGWFACQLTLMLLAMLQLLLIPEDGFWNSTAIQILASVILLGMWIFYDRIAAAPLWRNLMACFAVLTAFFIISFLPLYFALPLWLLLAAGVVVYGIRCKHHPFCYVGYIVLLLGIFTILDSVKYLEDRQVQYTIAATIDIAVTLYFRHKKPHPGMELVSRCVTGYLMLYGLTDLLLSDLFHTFGRLLDAFLSLFGRTVTEDSIRWDWILFAVVVTAVFALNAVHILKQYRTKMAAGVYWGVRTTAWALVLLQVFSPYAELSSGVLILLSFGMLLLGFRVRQKGLRIYSLVTLLFFLCKLLLIDLYSGKSLLWAGSFLLCGLLCFAISFLYNRVDQAYFKKSLPESEQK